jgi:hypothetical protein
MARKYTVCLARLSGFLFLFLEQLIGFPLPFSFINQIHCGLWLISSIYISWRGRVTSEASRTRTDQSIAYSNDAISISSTLIF